MLLPILIDTKEHSIEAIFNFQVFRFAPPLIVKKEDADFTVDVIRRALVNLERRL